MASISSFYGVTSDSVSTLFSSINNSSSTNAGGGAGILSDYYSIKNGSYKKLITAYYNKTDKSDSSTDASRVNSSTSNDSTKTLAQVKSSANSLYDTAEALLKNGTTSIFARKDGKYNIDNIYDGVQKFADAYNKVLEDASDANSTSILRTADNMVKTTRANIRNLANIGITVGTDNKISIDKDKFKNSQVSDILSVFHGAGSYGYSVSAKASQLVYNVNTEASKAGTYSYSGKYDYNYSAGDIYDKLF